MLVECSCMVAVAVGYGKPMGWAAVFGSER